MSAQETRVLNPINVESQNTPYLIKSNVNMFILLGSLVMYVINFMIHILSNKQEIFKNFWLKQIFTLVYLILMITGIFIVNKLSKFKNYLLLAYFILLIIKICFLIHKLILSKKEEYNSIEIVAITLPDIIVFFIVIIIIIFNIYNYSKSDYSSV